MIFIKVPIIKDSENHRKSKAKIRSTPSEKKFKQKRPEVVSPIADVIANKSL
jgi:hypothetical protein